MGLLNNFIIKACASADLLWDKEKEFRNPKQLNNRNYEQKFKLSRNT